MSETAQPFASAPRSRLARLPSYLVSGLLHGSVLLYLVLGARIPHPEPARSLYDLAIRAQERHIVWYRADRLPDVSPAAAPRELRPPRALRKFDQTLVAGKQDDPKTPPRLVWNPEPEVTRPVLEPLPNLVAVTAPRPVRPMSQPEQRRPAAAVPVLPEAPVVTASMNGPAATPSVQLKSPLRRFDAPRTEVRDEATPKLPEAPVVTASMNAAAAAPDAQLSAPVRRFDAPRTELRREGMPKLPEAPAVAAGAPASSQAPGEVRLAGPLRTFATAPGPARRESAPSLPDAPAVGTAVPAGPATLPSAAPARALRQFAGAAPATPASNARSVGVANMPEAAQPAIAIAGLNPSRTPDIPVLPPPQQGSFSAGPVPHADGGENSGSTSGVIVPGLLTRDGRKEDRPVVVTRVTPFTREALIAGARSMPAAKGPEPAAPESPAQRVSSAPDPFLQGRLIYTMAIQMPNITSYIGSWLVWFAEREPSPERGEIRPPLALHKVDPKYVVAAVEERVEGTVRLAAIIRKDGLVEEVRLLKHLDDRLDRTAQEALAKWRFEPATRNGAAVAVDAIFEVPFRLAPRSAR
jgi:TonB family protein